MEKICVFCGNPPNNKNNEHVLPQWLLGFTGDPNRVVRFGFNHDTGKELKFNWSKFTAPACTDCNSTYSAIESEAKLIVEKLQNKLELTGNELLSLLDWLDKVRVGLWLNYYFLENNKGGIKPHLSVKGRVGKKDRFLQIHFLKSKKDQKGLNAFGADSLSFQFNPSSIGLRINDLLLINFSNDFIVSKNCGFPNPEKIESKDEKTLELSDWIYDRETHPELYDLNMPKGVLTVMQPIHTQMQYSTNFFSDGYLIRNCMDLKNRVGTLFRIKENKVIPLYDLTRTVEYESVKGKEVRFVGEIIAKVYEAQNRFLANHDGLRNKHYQISIDINNKYIAYHQQPPKKDN